MKKICVSFNHLQYSDGVARAAISMANHLATFSNVEVVLRPIFKFDKSTVSLLSSNIQIIPVFGHYFWGLGKILYSLPPKILYKLCFGGSYNYDILIAFQYGITIKALAGSKPSTNFITKVGWMHGYDEKMIQKKYYLTADKMICVSKESAERLRRDLDNQVEVDYCYNLLDERVILEKAKHTLETLQNNVPKFVSVGRLSEEKGYSRLIDIVKQLSDEGFAFQLKIVGNGPKFQTLQKKIVVSDLAEVVILCGKQSNPYKIVAEADLFICSSFAEGYSTACTEAVILGVPVLTTRVGGAQEIIETSRAGMLVENNRDSLYNGLKSILEDPSQIIDWKELLKTSKENFYLSKRTKRLEKILDLK